MYIIVISNINRLFISNVNRPSPLKTECLNEKIQSIDNNSNSGRNLLTSKWFDQILTEVGSHERHKLFDSALQL